MLQLLGKPQENPQLSAQQRPRRGQSGLGSPGLFLGWILGPQSTLAPEEVSALAVPWKLLLAQTFGIRSFSSMTQSHTAPRPGQPAFSVEWPASLQTWVTARSAQLSRPGVHLIAGGSLHSLNPCSVEKCP